MQLFVELDLLGVLSPTELTQVQQMRGRLARAWYRARTDIGSSFT